VRAQGVQQVEQGRVHGADVAAAEVAQEVVHGAQRIGQVAAGGEILHLQRLAGVQVAELQHARLAAARLRECGRRGEGGNETTAVQQRHAPQCIDLPAQPGVNV